MFQVGQSIGDYAILQELGKGGYGEVYKVEHTITGRREAMKLLAATNTNAAEQSERFLREIRLQASLSHPNIAAVHTAFWVNDDLALVCELLEGESLLQRLERQPLSREQALDVMAQVLDALSYAHARGIIHRDISPANIFLTAGGPVKIIDFGLAKAATDLRLTREGSPIGAAHYMSPEQIRGAQDIDVRTDIYSCGVVLYELVVGTKPFDGDSAFTIMKAHTEEPPPSPTAVNAQVPPALSAILLRALAKQPEARFQSADAFVQAIKEVPKEEPAPGPAKEHRSLSRRVLILACAALTILIGVLVASVTTRLGHTQSQVNKSFAVPPPPVAITPPSVVPPVVRAQPARAARKTPRRKQAPVVADEAAAVPATTNALIGPAEPVEPTADAPPAADSVTPAPASAPPEAKPKNPVVKLGGVLKRINPFQQNRKEELKTNGDLSLLPPH
jgi:eukaryotic-like serine/threonine-protein kinase